VNTGCLAYVGDDAVNKIGFEHLSMTTAAGVSAIASVTVGHQVLRRHCISPHIGAMRSIEIVMIRKLA